MRNHFWARWSKEYLHTLQQRAKWHQPRENIKTDDIVVISDPALLNHGRWTLGRVVAHHPGRDGLVRLANVRTQHGEYTRPVTKLCKLPVSH